MKFIAGIDTFWRVTCVKVFVELKATYFLDYGYALVFGNTRVDGGFIYNYIAWFDDLADSGRRSIKWRKVRIVVFIDRSWNCLNVEVAVANVIDIGGSLEIMILNGVLK